MAKSVAVIGASNDRSKFGNKAVRAFRDAGYTVYPVNPKEEKVEGLAAYPSISDVPDPLDCVSLYVPPAIGLKLMPLIAAKKPSKMWLNPGTESREIIALAKDAGIEPIRACSIIAIGKSPGMYS